MNNPMEKRNASEGTIGMGLSGAGKGGGTAGKLAAAVEGIVPVAVVVTRAVGQEVGPAGGGLVRIGGEKSGAGGAGESEKGEIDGEAGAVAEVSEEEARGMSLTDKQCVAIAQLTLTRSKIKAATAAGVSRMTVDRWLKHDPAFKAALHLWQEDVISTVRGELMATTKDAMRTVIKAIRGGDAKLAWKLLESLGVTEKVEPGATDVEELKKKEEMERKKREVEEKREKRKLESDELMNPWG
jgi:hypothetical protein